MVVWLKRYELYANQTGMMVVTTTMTHMVIMVPLTTMGLDVIPSRLEIRGETHLDLSRLRRTKMILSHDPEPLQGMKIQCERRSTFPRV